jgi:hypothetical protein
MFRGDRNPTDRQLRSFTLLVPAVLIALAAVSRLAGRPVLALVLLSAAIAIALLPLAGRRATRSIYLLWMRAGSAIGAVVFTVLLTLMYFLLLPPFSLIRRRDPLRLRRGSNTDWIDCPARPADLERMRRAF